MPTAVVEVGSNDCAAVFAALQNLLVSIALDYIIVPHRFMLSKICSLLKGQHRPPSASRLPLSYPCTATLFDTTPATTYERVRFCAPCRIWSSGGAPNCHFHACMCCENPTVLTMHDPSRSKRTSRLIHHFIHPAFC